MIVLCLTVKRPDTLPFVASTCNNRVSHGNSYHLSTLHCYDAPQPLFRSLSLSRVSAVLSVWSLLTAVLFLVASFHVQVHSGAVGFPSLPSSDRQGPQKSASCSSYKLKEKTKIIINVLIILIMNCLQPPVLLYRSNNIDWDHQNLLLCYENWTPYQFAMTSQYNIRFSIQEGHRCIVTTMMVEKLLTSLHVGPMLYIKWDSTDEISVISPGESKVIHSRLEKVCALPGWETVHRGLSQGFNKWLRTNWWSVCWTIELG